MRRKTNVKMLKSIILRKSRNFKLDSVSFCTSKILKRFQSSHTRLSNYDINEIIKKLENYKGKVYPDHTFLKVDVRWGDQDAMNHVNHIKYFQFLEQVRVNWFFERYQLVPSAVEAEINGVKTLPILARAEMFYKRPVTYPDSLLIGFSSQATNKPRGDFKHTYIIYSTSQKQIVSTAELYLVAYDFTEKKRQSVPDDWVF